MGVDEVLDGDDIGFVSGEGDGISFFGFCDMRGWDVKGVFIFDMGEVGIGGGGLEYSEGVTFSDSGGNERRRRGYRERGSGISG